MQKKKNTLEEIHLFNVDQDSREIFLHSNYEEDDEVSFSLAAKFIKNLHYLDSLNSRPIIIHLQCAVGGDTVYGLSVFDAIKASHSQISMLVYGAAASMSSIILQAADKRVLFPNSHLMIHDGFLGFDGTPKSSEQFIKWSKETHAVILDVFAEKCIKGPQFKGKSIAQVKNYINSKLKELQDWYINANDAVHLGLADAIFGTEGCPNLECLK